MPSLDQEQPLLRAVLSERVKLVAFLRSIVRRRDMAEDLFQDLCVLVLQKADQIPDMAHLPAWLRTAARQLAMNALRKHGNRNLPLGEKVSELMEPHWRTMDAASGTSMSDALEACLAALSEPSRQLLKKKHADGFTGQELSRQLGRPVGSLYTTLSRIHKKLAECILRRVASARGSHA
ncbi:MAG TPA: sigma-70 family RNA polymerase sigma factor [Tepidisphaeraceae bacterium]|nr:sigma-70 family RNA polymerase sigma factor [Tepidisphaeraceae bacterium]